MNEKNVNVTVDGVTYGISLKYRNESQDLLFFLHGLGCSKDSFSDVWVHQDFKHLSLLSLDLIGFGRSAKPAEFSYSMESHAEVCEALIKIFPKQRLHIIAHSMGGAIGLLLSRDILNSAKSFINIEGNLIGEDCTLASRQTISVPYSRFERELFPAFKSQLSFKEQSLYSLDTASPFAFYMSAKSLVEWSDSGQLLERFKSLRCHKVYFYGDWNSGMEVLKKIGNIEKREVRNSGHFLMHDNPREFYSNLRASLYLAV